MVFQLQQIPPNRGAEIVDSHMECLIRLPFLTGKSVHAGLQNLVSQFLNIIGKPGHQQGFDRLRGNLDMPLQVPGFLAEEVIDQFKTLLHGPLRQLRQFNGDGNFLLQQRHILVRAGQHQVHIGIFDFFAVIISKGFCIQKIKDPALLAGIQQVKAVDEEHTAPGPFKTAVRPGSGAEQLIVQGRDVLCVVPAIDLHQGHIRVQYRVLYSVAVQRIDKGRGAAAAFGTDQNAQGIFGIPDCGLSLLKCAPQRSVDAHNDAPAFFLRLFRHRLRQPVQHRPGVGLDQLTLFDQFIEGGGDIGPLLTQSLGDGIGLHSLQMSSRAGVYILTNKFKNLFFRTFHGMPPAFSRLFSDIIDSRFMKSPDNASFLPYSIKSFSRSTAQIPQSGSCLCLFHSGTMRH